MNTTLRYRHRGLREYIRSKLHRDATNGDVYIFLSRKLNRIRVYYFHHNGEILTEKILHAHRFTHPIFLDTTKHVYHISWSSFVYLLEGVIRKEKDEYFDEETEEEIDDNDIFHFMKRTHAMPLMPILNGIVQLC